MRDQASQLRALQNTFRGKIPPNPARKSGPRTIAITSGKGGVGKTNVCLNLGIAIAQKGKKVLLLDADLNLGNLDVLLGMSPQYTLRNVIAGQMKLEQVLVEGPEGIKVIPASSGALELTEVDSFMRQQIINELSELKEPFDFLLIDTPAGIGHHVFDFINYSQQTLVLTTPEPTAIIDAYAVIKLLWQRRQSNAAVHLVINNVTDKTSAEEVYQKLNLVTQRFLNKKINEWTFIEYDQRIPTSVQEQQPFLTLFPDSDATRAIFSLREKLLAPAHRTPAVQTEFVEMY